MNKSYRRWCQEVRRMLSKEKKMDWFILRYLFRRGYTSLQAIAHLGEIDE